MNLLLSFILMNCRFQKRALATTNLGIQIISSKLNSYIDIKIVLVPSGIKRKENTKNYIKKKRD